MRLAAWLGLFCATVAAGDLDQAERAVVKVAKKVRPAVVTVVTPNKKDLDQTGVVIAPGGVILTLRGPLVGRGGALPSQVLVRFPGKGDTVMADVLADDAATDTCLLKAKGRAKPLSVGRSEDAFHGGWVILVGNTFGQGRESTPTVSLGVLSGIVRDRDGVAAYHASTLVNPGSFGAPVVDLSGDLLGIVARKVTGAGGQSVVIPFERVRARYADKGSRISGYFGREPPPRRRRMHVADVFGFVVQETVERAKRALVGVRAGAVLAGAEPAPKKKKPKLAIEGFPAGKKKRGPPVSRPVPGRLDGTDRSSGLIVAPDGWIVCPLRVTGWPGPRRALTVDLPDGRHLLARVAGIDERLRFALLKVKAFDLPTLEPAARRTIRAGQFAFALGFPHGDPEHASPQVTVGIVSRGGGLARLHPGFRAVQTDAGVSGGNRGGPLVDLDGRLLGMLLDVDDTEMFGYSTRVAARYGPNSGLGFALPASVIADLLPRLRKGESLEAAYLGIRGVPEENGLRIVVVHAKNSRDEPSTAAAAGLRKGDVLVSIDGVELRAIEDLVRALAARAAGDRVEIVYRREGKQERAAVVLARR